MMCTRFRTERIHTFLGRNLKGLPNLSFLAHAILQTWDGKTLWPSHCCSLKSRWNLQPPPPVWRCPQRRQFTPCPCLPNHLFSCYNIYTYTHCYIYIIYIYNIMIIYDSLHISWATQRVFCRLPALCGSRQRLNKHMLWRTAESPNSSSHLPLLWHCNSAVGPSSAVEKSW